MGTNKGLGRGLDALLSNDKATSVSLEDPFWQQFKKIAQERDLALNELAAEIDARRGTNVVRLIQMSMKLLLVKEDGAQHKLRSCTNYQQLLKIFLMSQH